LVNAVVPKGEPMSAARELAETIASAAPLAVAAVKEVLRATEHLGIEEAYSVLRSDQVSAYRRMLASEDIKEGPRAFAENRQPVWRGK
jgi:crotonobetainyl-CoA hydratase